MFGHKKIKLERSILRQKCAHLESENLRLNKSNNQLRAMLLARPAPGL